MQLGYFTEEAYNKLYQNIDLNIDKYMQDNDWINSYFENDAIYYHISNAVNVDDYELISLEKQNEQDKSREDLTNVEILYTALKKLSPLQASNKYMWTYLCHAIPKNRQYIKNRWLQNIRENTIRERFFVKSESSLWNDNALSRLWWYGYFTYEENNSNPFELTEILLTNQTLATDVIDTINRMNPVRIKGVLYGIRKYIEYIHSTIGVSDDFRECKKRLNQYAAVTNFDFLNYEDIEQITFETLLNIYKTKHIK